MSDKWVPNPKPIEEVDPEFAELVSQYISLVTTSKLKKIPKVGRNEPCPCGASKNGKRIKFKRCTCNQFHPK